MKTYCNLKQEALGPHRSPGKQFQSMKLSQSYDHTFTLARSLPPFWESNGQKKDDNK